MPELPEVETTCRGIAPHVEGRRIRTVLVRRRQLRWPVPREIESILPDETIADVRRRAKYLLLETAPGALLVHLGMSGSLRVLDEDVPPGKHDHVDVVLDDGHLLRLHDPRCFGSVLWQPAGTTHRLLADLGPEPLGGDFDGDHLWRTSRGRKRTVKAFIMDHHVVVGVGNIYASEALFVAGIHPKRAAGRISRGRYRELADAIRHTLRQAIERGGTSLRDFSQPDGQPGYFAIDLKVYGRAGQPCPTCGHAIASAHIGQRNSFWCPRCQR